MNNEGDTAGHGAHGIVSPALVDALVTGHHPPDVQLAVLGCLDHPAVLPRPGEGRPRVAPHLTAEADVVPLAGRDVLGVGQEERRDWKINVSVRVSVSACQLSLTGPGAGCPVQH